MVPHGDGETAEDRQDAVPRDDHSDDLEKKEEHPEPEAPTDTRMPRPSNGGKNRRNRTKQLSTTSLNWEMPTDIQAQEHVKEEKGDASWQFRVLKILHRHKVQTLFAALLGLDVLILFTELALLTQYPPCNLIERDGISCIPYDEYSNSTNYNSQRQLAGGSICPEGFVETPYTAGCDGHKYANVHTAEHILFYFTIMILSVFFVELTVSMIALTPQVFFRQVFYVLDYFIVSVSISLETTFHALGDDVLQSLVGFVIIIRLWRFIRIGHGIVEVVNEVVHDRENQFLIYIEELEDRLCQAGMTLPAGSMRPIPEHNEEHPQILHRVEKRRRDKARNAYRKREHTLSSSL